jgi:Ca2+-binding RTX toxin-like protein
LVYGNDGDDKLSGSDLSGGPGADVLTGTERNDRLIGGGGPDALAGGVGSDLLMGDGDGNVAADVMDGGPGADTVSYDEHRVSVRIDITSQTGGDGDRLSGFENAHGGHGDDVLVGDGGPNVLDGWTGRNTVLGGAGDDTVTAFTGGRLDGGEGDDVVDAVLDATSLEGGPGDDRLSGGFGVDQFSGGEGDDVVEVSMSAVQGQWREKIRCGAGRDVVVRPFRALVRPDCEAVTESDEVGAERLPAYPRGGRLALPRNLRRGRVELRLDRHRRPFATMRFERASHVRLRIPRAIRRLPRDPLRITIRIVGPWRCWMWVIDLRPP